MFRDKSVHLRDMKKFIVGFRDIAISGLAGFRDLIHLAVMYSAWILPFIASAIYTGAQKGWKDGKP